jgi:hypothetical protein
MATASAAACNCGALPMPIKLSSSITRTPRAMVIWLAGPMRANG